VYLFTTQLMLVSNYTAWWHNGVNFANMTRGYSNKKRQRSLNMCVLSNLLIVAYTGKFAEAWTDWRSTKHQSSTSLDKHEISESQ